MYFGKQWGDDPSSVERICVARILRWYQRDSFTLFPNYESYPAREIHYRIRLPRMPSRLWHHASGTLECGSSALGFVLSWPTTSDHCQWTNTRLSQRANSWNSCACRTPIYPVLLPGICGHGRALSWAQSRLHPVRRPTERRKLEFFFRFPREIGGHHVRCRHLTPGTALTTGAPR